MYQIIIIVLLILAIAYTSYILFLSFQMKNKADGIRPKNQKQYFIAILIMMLFVISRLLKHLF